MSAPQGNEAAGGVCGEKEGHFPSRPQGCGGRQGQVRHVAGGRAVPPEGLLPGSAVLLSTSACWGYSGLRLIARGPPPRGGQSAFLQVLHLHVSLIRKQPPRGRGSWTLTEAQQLCRGAPW